MANRSTNGKKVPPPVPETPEGVDSLTKVITFRVPESLHVQAKLCADAYGVPFNALVCIALGEFLTEKGYRVHPASPVKRR